VATSEDKAVKKAQKKQAKTQKKAAKKEYERTHKQPKRVATMSSALTAAQVKRNKSAAK
jgi:hypothetical protein